MSSDIDNGVYCLSGSGGSSPTRLLASLRGAHTPEGPYSPSELSFETCV